MWPRHLNGKTFAITLPERMADALDTVPDPSRYVLRLLDDREHGSRAAAGVLLRAGWSADEILAAAVGWARYYDGPPTEYVEPSLQEVRAITFGAEHEDVVTRFGLDPEAWLARVRALQTAPALADAIIELGRELLRGAGVELLALRLRDVARR